MKIFSTRAVSLPLAALAALLASGVPEASALNLFDLLFGNRDRREQRIRTAPQRQYQPRRAAPQRTAPRRAAPRITGPAYYNYRADGLKAVAFAPLAAIAQSASLEESPAAAPFREAVAGLEGFELLAEAEIGKAVVAHYTEHPAFIWVDGGGLDDRAREAMDVLGDAGSHGLPPADYAVAVPAAGGSAGL